MRKLINTHEMFIASEILRYIQTNAAMKIYSWGVRCFGEYYDMHKDEITVVFHVQGMMFQGWVHVGYDETADCFRVYLSKELESKKTLKYDNIYIDDVIELIDQEVEKPIEMSNEEYKAIMNVCYSSILFTSN
ncbi:MAG: hypothetical protein ACRDDZ_05525 [Marinifilaceae bacterium]